MATKPKKKAIKPRPAKDIKPGDMRSQVLKTGQPQAAKDVKYSGARAKFLRDAKAGLIKAKGSTALTTTNKPPATTSKAPSGKGGAPKGTPRLSSDATPKRLSGPSTAVKAAGIGGTIAKQVWSKVGGPATMLIAMTQPVGEGSDKPSGPLMKGNNMKPTFPKGKGTAAQPKPKAPIMPKASMSGGGVNRPEVKSSGGEVRKKGAGTYTKSYDVDKKKSAPTSKAATAAAAPKRSRPETRYERNSLAMEQRKSSGSSPRKSILSLFKKG